MAKILVADDNSNVQKTVALALVDLGVDVVSVNNGEAAVRKLSDFAPDLILADIFMPVRNGYEVCEYVKKDSRFHRVPVVLLVGAFDPLDEREAQRVGADGILKKPFVPPDPLIAMVKTLLDRALGDHLVGVSASPPPVAVEARSAASAPHEVSAPPVEQFEEPSAEEFPPPMERVAFAEGEHPVAFGTLLETPAEEVAPPKLAVIEPVDDEQILTSARDATLGDPIFWKNDAPEPEPEPEAEEALAEASAGLDTRSWKHGDDSLPRREEAALLQPVEPLELVRDEDLQGAEPSVAQSGSILLDQAAQASLNVDSHTAEDLAANPIEWMATAPPIPTQEPPEETPGWDEPIAGATDTIDKVESPEQDSKKTLTPVSPETPAPVLVPVQEHTVATAIEKIPAPVVPVTVPPGPPVSAHQEMEMAPVVPPQQSAEDTARAIPKDTWADITATIRPIATELVTQQLKTGTPAATSISAPQAGGPAVPAATAPTDGPTDPALVDAVVQRVLDKMRPQVVDIITKEFLRPIVETLVQKEIDKH